jgi:hypothetical protein
MVADQRRRRSRRAAGSATPVAADRVADMEANSRGVPLARPIGDRLVAALGPSVSSVRIHTDSSAAEAAEALEARAYARGQDVFFAEGEYRPGTADGDHLIAHEVAHTAQDAGGDTARGSSAATSSPGDAHEAEADRFADAFVAGASTEGIVGRSAAARPPRSRQELPARERPDYPARTYAQVNVATIAQWVQLHLMNVPLRIEQPYAAWIEGSRAFLRELVVTMARFGGGDRFLEVLEKAVLPERLDRLVDRGRVAATRGDGGGDSSDNSEEPLGTLRWFPDVGVAIADAIVRRLVESFRRVIPRYVAARLRAWQEDEDKRRPDGGTTPDIPEPPPDRVLAAHPMDLLVSRTLCSGGLVEIDAEAYRRDHPRLEGEDLNELGDASAVRWDFVEDPSAFHWIRVTHPPSPTVELVAAAVLGSPQESDRVTAVPPLFALSFADARRLRRERGLPVGEPGRSSGSWLGDLAAKATAEAAVAATDPAQGLLESDLADEAALLEAGEGTGPADRAHLLDNLEQVHISLVSCEEAVRPFGLAVRLQPAIQRARARVEELEGAPDAEVVKWSRHAQDQRDVFPVVVAGLTSIRQHLDGMGVGTDRPVEGLPAEVRGPLARAAGSYVDAAALSHLPRTAMERALAAQEALQLAPLETMELILQDVQAKLEGARAYDFRSKGFLLGYDRAGTQGDEEDLRREVSVLRARVLAGDSAIGGELAALYDRVRALQLAADIGAGYAAFSQLGEIFYELRWDAWVVAGRKDDEAADFSREAATYSGRLKTAWDLYRKGELDEAQAILSALSHDDGFRSFLQRAHDKIENIEDRVLIVKIAAIVGIALVSLGVGAAVEGAALGYGMSTTTAFVAGAATEAALFTALDAATFGRDDYASTFMSEFGVNLATFGLLRAWGRTSRRLTKLEDAGDATRLHRYVHGGVEITGQALIIAGTTYAHIQLESLREEGRTLSLEEMKAMARKGMAMFFAVAVLGRLTGLQDRLRDLGFRGGAHAREVADVRALARRVEKTGDPDLALELLRRDRKLLEIELEARRARARDAGISPEELARLDAVHQSKHARLDLTEIALSLDEIVPGREYFGTSEKLAPILATLRANGAEVHRVQVSDGRVYHTVKHGDARLKLHEARSPARSKGSSDELDLARSQSFDERKRVLGQDPKRGYIEHEGAVGAQIEPTYGYFKRDPSGAAEWISLSGPHEGKTFDLVGIPPGRAGFHGPDMAKFNRSVSKHFLKSVDFVVVDLKNVNPEQARSVKKHLKAKHSADNSRLILLE